MPRTPDSRFGAIPPLYRPVFGRVETSRAAAVKAMCLQCAGFERRTVRECSDETCPLHTWRPYQAKDDPEEAPE